MSSCLLFNIFREFVCASENQTEISVRCATIVLDYFYTFHSICICRDRMTRQRILSGDLRFATKPNLKFQLTIIIGAIPRTYPILVAIYESQIQILRYSSWYSSELKFLLQLPIPRECFTLCSYEI